MSTRYGYLQQQHEKRIKAAFDDTEAAEMDSVIPDGSDVQALAARSQPIPPLPPPWWRKCPRSHRQQSNRCRNICEQNAMSSGRNITKADIKAAFDDTPAAKMHDVILDVNGVSRLFGYSTSTIYEWVKKGRFDGCYRKRGKGMRFWRDKVIDRFFNGPDWSSQNEN